MRGDITSPTFVIARVHPSLGTGPALVHADAYRLGGIDELDDLDLDASLDEAVTVVEWGTGVAEGLADSRLEVRIARSSEAVDGELDPGRSPWSPSALAGSASPGPDRVVEPASASERCRALRVAVSTRARRAPRLDHRKVRVGGVRVG